MDWPGSLYDRRCLMIAKIFRNRLPTFSYYAEPYAAILMTASWMEEQSHGLTSDPQQVTAILLHNESSAFDSHLE